MIIDTSVDPGVPISREAALVHGITDADVRGKPGVHRVMEELEPHGLIASHNVRFTRTALNSSLGRERIGFHRSMTMCAMKTYAGFRSEMNPATGEHAWAGLAQIELFVDPDQQMVRVDEIPQVPGCELEQGGVSAAAVQWLQHPLPSSLVTGLPAIVVRRSAFVTCGRLLSKPIDMGMAYGASGRR